MQDVSTALETRLGTAARRPALLLEVYGVAYAPDAVTGFNPAAAEERFSDETINWNGLDYRRELKSKPSVKKTVGKEFNAIAFEFSNVDRYMATFVVANPVAGKWCVLRYAEKDITDSSVVLFIGKFDPPGDLDQINARLSAKVSFGSITQQVPWRDFQSRCPLTSVFKVQGEDCQGFKDVSGARVPLTLAEKPAPYQAATECDGSHDACIARQNTEFFQGIFYSPILGSFVYPVQTTSRFLLLFHRTRTRSQTGQYSNQDVAVYGQPVPMLLGRAQLEGKPVRFADEGYYLVGWYAWCEGRLTAIQNLRNNTTQFGQPFAVNDRLGDYGGLGGQTPVTHNGQVGEFYSRLAYSALAINGSAPDVVDSPPVVSAVCVGEYLLPDGSGVYTLFGATDNPYDLVRHYLTDHHAMRHPAALIDDAEGLVTRGYCDAAILDTSGTDIVPLPTSVTQPDASGHTQAGTDWRLYRPTGTVDAQRYLTGGSHNFYDREVDYPAAEFPPTADPATQSITAPTVLRKRFTINTVVTDRTAAIDFLYDVLLPAARLYLVTGANGKIKVRVERPADDTYLRADALALSSTLKVDDVTPWVASLKGKVLLNPGDTASDVREAILAAYTADANTVTLAAAGAGGATLTASGATFTGGSVSARASATVTLGGSATAGATLTATIDGVAVVYTLRAGDTLAAAAQLLRDTINAHPTAQRLVTATWASGSPTVVTLQTKMGVLTLDAPLTYDHFIGEEAIRVMMAFDASSLGTNTFKWPGSNRRDYNRVELKYRSAKDDFAEITIRYDSPTLQANLDKANTLTVDGSAIDNFNQAYRVLLAVAAKELDGNKFATWETRSGLALLLEEGDVVCVTDTSAGLVNYPVRLEQLALNAKMALTLTGRQYSTSMYVDTAPTAPVRIPSTLINQPQANTTLRLLNQPILRAGDGAFGALVAAGVYLGAALPGGTSAWPTASVYIDRGAGYVFLADVPLEATLGTAVFALPTATAGAWDNTHTITVDLQRPNATLPTGSQTNPTRIILGTETIDYATATQLSTSPNRWQLGGGLYRGAAGTAGAVGSHLSTDKFTLADAALQYVAVEAGDVGVSRNFKVIQKGMHPQVLAQVTAVAFTVQAMALPPDVTSVRIAEAGGGHVASWTRIAEAAYPDFDSYVVYRDTGSGLTEVARTRDNQFFDPYPVTTPQLATWSYQIRVKACLNGNRLSAGYDVLDVTGGGLQIDRTHTHEPVGAPVLTKPFYYSNYALLNAGLSATAWVSSGVAVSEDHAKAVHVEVYQDDGVTFLYSMDVPADPSGSTAQIQISASYATYGAVKVRAKCIHYIDAVIQDSPYCALLRVALTPFQAADLPTAGVLAGGKVDTGSQTFAGQKAFQDGAAVGTHVLQGSGLKHERFGTGSVAAGATVDITCTWASAFADASYTSQASMEEANAELVVVGKKSQAAGSVVVTIKNNGAVARAGTIHLTAMHD
jgi:hypothetical protein